MNFTFPHAPKILEAWARQLIWYALFQHRASFSGWKCEENPPPKKPSHAWSFSIQPTNDPLVIFLLLFAEIAFHKTLGRLLLCGPGKNHFPALRKKRQSTQNLNAHLQRSAVPFSMLGWLHFLFSYWQRIFICNAELMANNWIKWSKIQ